jgi:hypothetical protein
MKKFIVVISIPLISSCSMMDCFSNSDYALKQANKFCSQANDNEAICGSLKINDKNVCEVDKKNKSVCMANEEGYKIFVRIPYFECNQLEQNQCMKREECKWTMIHLDPLHFMLPPRS